MGPLLVQVTVVPALICIVDGENEKSLIVTWGPEEDDPPQAAAIASTATMTNHFGRMDSSFASKCCPRPMDCPMCRLYSPHPATHSQVATLRRAAEKIDNVCAAMIRPHSAPRRSDAGPA